MQGKDTIKSTFDQLFAAVTSFTQNLKNREVDKYVKKFTALKFILLMSFAQLNQLKSLRDISNHLNDEQLAEAIALSEISASQISRKQRSDLLDAIKALFYDVIHQAGIKQGFNQVREKIGKLLVIDSTVISLCLSQYRWADFRETKSGVKVHLRLRLSNESVLPDAAVITAARKADRTQMDDLVTEDPDAFFVFDRAYVDYDKFDCSCDQGIRFASRLKASALVEVKEEFPVTPDSTIIKDSMVVLGKKGNEPDEKCFTDH